MRRVWLLTNKNGAYVSWTTVCIHEPHDIHRPMVKQKQTLKVPIHLHIQLHIIWSQHDFQTSCIKQCFSLKLFVKFNKMAAKSHHVQTEVYREECISHADVFEWHKRFYQGWEDKKADKYFGHPCKSSTSDNTKKNPTNVYFNQCFTSNWKSK